MLGVVTVSTFTPTDGNNLVNDTPVSFTTALMFDHNFLAVYGIRITFPSDFTIATTSSCTVTGQNSAYECSGV